MKLYVAIKENIYLLSSEEFGATYLSDNMCKKECRAWFILHWGWGPPFWNLDTAQTHSSQDSFHLAKTLQVLHLMNQGNPQLPNCFSSSFKSNQRIMPIFPVCMKHYNLQYLSHQMAELESIGECWVLTLSQKLATGKTL